MHEDDYTGSPIEDGDEFSRLEEDLVGVYEVDLDEDPLSFDADDSEMVLHVGGVADGAKSLQEAAEKLYDLADEMLAMSAEGWEFVDDVVGGYGTAVRFESDDAEEVSFDG